MQVRSLKCTRSVVRLVRSISGLHRAGGGVGDGMEMIKPEISDCWTGRRTDGNNATNTTHNKDERTLELRFASIAFSS